MLKPEETQQIKKFVKYFNEVSEGGNGGPRIRLAKRNSDGVTHLITPARMSSGSMLKARTMKYFVALLNKQWILCHDWIIDSLSRSELLDEEKYLVKGDTVALGAAAKCRFTVHVVI